MDQDQIFKAQARAKLEFLAAVLDEHYPGWCQEGESHMELRLESGQVYLWHIHYTMRQIWLSSPISGGRHFAFRNGQWRDTRNNEDFDHILTQELGLSL